MDRNEGPVVGSHVLGEEEPLFKEGISSLPSRNPCYLTSCVTYLRIALSGVYRSGNLGVQVC